MKVKKKKKYLKMKKKVSNLWADGERGATISLKTISQQYSTALTSRGLLAESKMHVTTNVMIEINNIMEHNKDKNDYPAAKDKDNR